ncbi:Transmembrane protein FAM155A [Triplophysa tibetana]|uniref:Transmembrane protein FAM155A n=1 Tax=Triplophysa tibetana TaxID=1572043 RepID=A0A5A9P5H9_9TELE|nr:Transmembrane protein FAM155A [Triplophysa tibetana]
MTRGVWTCRQQDDGLKIWFAPREDEKPLFTDSERAQRWRLSLASLLFITVLLSDHLWFCAEAKLTRTRDKRQDNFAVMDTVEHTNHILSSSHQPVTEQSLIFIGNSTKPLWRLETCHPDSLSKNCLTFADADAVCSGLSEWNLSDFYLSFCDSYSLLDLFYGFTSPNNLTCSLDMAAGGNTSGCTQCVEAYQLYDREAQKTYREFEIMVQKYETDVYSVRTCMDECTGWWRSPSMAKRLICHSMSLELAYRPQPWGLFDMAQRLSGKPEDKAKDHDPILLSPHGPEMRSQPVGHSCDHCFP